MRGCEAIVCLGWEQTMVLRSTPIVGPRIITADVMFAFAKTSSRIFIIFIWLCWNAFHSADKSRWSTYMLRMCLATDECNCAVAILFVCRFWHPPRIIDTSHSTDFFSIIMCLFGLGLPNSLPSPCGYVLEMSKFLSATHPSTNASSNPNSITRTEVKRLKARSHKSGFPPKKFSIVTIFRCLPPKVKTSIRDRESEVARFQRGLTLPDPETCPPISDGSEVSIICSDKVSLPVKIRSVRNLEENRRSSPKSSTPLAYFSKKWKHVTVVVTSEPKRDRSLLNYYFSTRCPWQSLRENPRGESSYLFSRKFNHSLCPGRF